MEKKPLLWKTLFSTPQLKVLDFLLQHPDLELNDTEIVARIKGVKRSAVNLALRALAKNEIVKRTRRGNMVFNRLLDSPFIKTLKIASNLMLMQTLIDELKTKSIRIVLFGSRAHGNSLSESDIDLFVVSDNPTAIHRIINKCDIGRKLQAIVKLPEEWLTLSMDDKVFYNTIKDGLLLWEKV